MSRDKIKILEFGLDDDGPSPLGSSDDGPMKIVEFGGDSDDGRKRVATARDVGHIKIIEFDNDLEARKTRAPEKTKRHVGPVKIKEFNEEPEVRESNDRTPKIKIMEFD